MDEILLEEEQSAYSVRLDQFEGPLDLLLHLVKEAKIEIRDIFVSDITEQYLEFMGQLGTIDMDRAVEFVNVTTTLLEIKVRSLVPKIEEFMPPEDDPKERLLKQIEEHKLFKEAGEKLKVFENTSSFYKVPDDSAFDYRIVLKDTSIEGLIGAFAKLLHKVDLIKTDAEPRIITKDRFTVAEKMEHMREVLYMIREVSFFELFEEDFTRSEMLNTFLALLELLKLQYITAEQNGVFQDIRITYVEHEE